MTTELWMDKKILIVDDDPDVLETLGDLLSEGHVVKASSFDEAKELLEKHDLDLAILDIMGVDGYALLEIAKSRDIIPVILTADAFTVEDTIKSFKEGAALYIPKEKMAEITVFLNDILEAKEKGINTWWRWSARLKSLYELRFGSDILRDKKFWDLFKEFYLFE